MSRLTKTEMSLVIWLNIVTIVARSARLFPAYMRKTYSTCYSSIALSVMVWSMLCQLPNMQKTLLQFTTLVCHRLPFTKKYLTGTGN